MDVSLITLRQVVLHSIPQAGFQQKDLSTIVLSDIPADLDARKRVFLEAKVKTALDARARPITEAPDAQTPAAREIRGYLQSIPNKRHLVECSRSLARLLYEAQPGTSPAGIVLIADLSFGSSDAIMLAKLDREDGMRAFTTNASGHTQVSIEYLDDLFVTDGTKVFKIGLFAADDIANNLLRGQVVDEQIGGHAVAHYFLHYLGCDFSQRPAEVTEHFLDTANNFINSNLVPDAETKAKYSLALLTTLQSEAKELNIRKFAHDHLLAKDRDLFVSEMEQHGVPIAPIAKDTSLISGRLKRVQIETDRDIFIMAPPGRLDDGTVTVKSPGGDAHAVVEIKDTVRRVTNRS